jgi:hypothetical protein
MAALHSRHFFPLQTEKRINADNSDPSVHLSSSIGARIDNFDTLFIEKKRMAAYDATANTGIRMEIQVQLP